MAVAAAATNPISNVSPWLPSGISCSVQILNKLTLKIRNASNRPETAMWADLPQHKPGMEMEPSSGVRLQSAQGIIIEGYHSK
jgi:hypothetical protein